MNTIPCEIIEDLLPSYKDNLLSDSVNEAVISHLKSCRECSDKFEILEHQIEESDLERVQKESAFLGKIKKSKHYIIGLIIGASIPIGAMVLFIIYVLIQSHIN